MSAVVVITDWGFPTLDPERAVFEGHGIELRAHQCRTEEDVQNVVADADVVMAQWAPVREHAMRAMTRCRGIVRYGIGLDNIDLEAASARGIPVRNVPDYCLDEVADHTLALMLALQRQLPGVERRLRAGTWKITPPLALPPLRQSVLGLVGFGRIARLVARRARAFGMTVTAFDPMVKDEEFRAEGVRRVEREELFSGSDILSLHCPLTPETRGIVNARTLAQMKPHALLVNTSRGGLVETGALVEALRSGTIAGAGLDVFDPEPLPADHPLRLVESALLTSHTAWYSNASVSELQRKAAQAALSLLKA
jgi:D-3-phosphoglycerate dehydrogenase